MDPQKTAFLFGDVTAGTDVSDPDERSGLIAARHPEVSPVELAVREAIAAQIIDDDPPEVWRSAQRLLALGMDDEDVMRQLVLTFTPYILEVLDGDGAFDLARYVAAVSRLPLPDTDDVRRALQDAARARRTATMEQLIADAAATLGAVADGGGVKSLFARLLDELLDEADQVQLLAGDVVVDVPTLLAEVVLTHRVDADRDDLFDSGIDLVAFDRVAGDEVVPVSGPGVVAVRFTDGALSVTPLAVEPELDPVLVERLRSCYDAAVAEPWLPVAIDELVLATVVADASSFAEPQAPLSRLLEAAGLEVRDDQVAHEASVWRTEEDFRAVRRLALRLDPEMLDTVIMVFGAVQGDVDTATARTVLDHLEDPSLLTPVSDLLFGCTDDPYRLETTAAVARRLAAAASRPAQRAVADWLLAVVAEREGRPREAERLLRDAVRTEPGWEPAVDRLAWYLSDVGDAPAALALWERMESTGHDIDDLRELRSLPATEPVTLGRNDRCWCGSGRKYKQCHLGRPEALPLPERVGWLCRKATGYLERRGGAPGEDILVALVTRTVDLEDQDSVREAASDPLVLDVVLHEGGWFECFLAERGELLPQDELLLAQAWSLVDRTIYEIEQTSPGVGVIVRDLRTGDRVEVRERTFSRAARVGQRVCARAVPDGVTHQFIGGLFAVAPGRELDLLDLLDRGDGLELLEYVCSMHRPPVVVGPDGRELDLSSLPIGPAPAPLQVDPDIGRQVMEHLEQRWCTEPVPALGHVTPEQAAADPTRRDGLARLLDSFPEPDPTTGVMGLRPQVLRERLGLGS
jgi:hypothetical protein